MCAICKRLCAPCWEGGCDDEIGDICGPCLALQQTNIYKIEEVAAVSRELAAVIAARENPGWTAVTAKERSDEYCVFFVALVRQEEIFAADGAREECRLHGHRPGYLGHGKHERCLRCGILLKNKFSDTNSGEAT